MKIGDRVSTEDGEGVIVDVENFSHPRYGVKLDSPPEWNAVDEFGYAPVYYWEKEINKV